MTETKTTDSGLSGLCGCGSPVRYTVPGDPQDLGACNKYARCPSYAELQQQERHLRQQLDVARDYLHRFPRGIPLPLGMGRDSELVGATRCREQTNNSLDL